MVTTRTRTYAWAVISTLTGLTLVVAAIVVPAAADIDVHVGISGYDPFPPLHANWVPEFGPRGILPIVVAVGVLVLWGRIDRLGWRAFVATTWVATWLWTFTLAYVDGPDGLSEQWMRRGEYVYDARRVTSVSEALSGFIDRIPIDAPDHWFIHVAGHPPGALLAFVGLDRVGITDEFWIGMTVMTIGTTAVVAALVAVRALGREPLARRAAPWLVLAPMAVWMGVSGDTLFVAVAAWGLALLAIASTRSRRAVPTYGVVAGVLLGYSTYLSYGLVLLCPLAIAVLVVAGTARALPWALAGALAVAAAFTLAGFAWWDAYPVLHERYYDGVASRRQYGYWVWANIAAWTFTAGLATWAAIPAGLRRVRERNPVAVLGCTALLCVLIATLSGMSKAEVERIWMPFTLWALMLPALLPVRWRTPLLAGQAATGLLVQILLLTRW
ncbi:hypothetical protein [Solicola gregarius]|uniref:Integral membrane protein n=1 Tax=Solicola gregarius TaxID=2908642 RepID=A0AA46TFT2_9ACTN|nr:hypothetical protein [Solicola gregarius]UYM04552.1 hypothetical protein L0C25_18745 [Solicola gregarius]